MPEERPVDPPEEPEPVVASEEPEPQVAEQPPEPQVADAAPPEPPPASYDVLKRHALAVARDLAEPVEDAEPVDRIARQFRPLPDLAAIELPSDPGDSEFNGYMMLDEEIVKQFRDVNGVDRVEVTLRNGKVMCGARQRNQFMPDPFLDDSNIFVWHECRKSFSDRRKRHAGWLW